MALQKTPVVINFSQGLDLKTDPKQVQIGKFLALQNSVFDKAGGLVKRNGYNNITNLPNDEQTALTTLNNNLLATGSNLYAYSADTNQWFNQGITQPIELDTVSIVRSTTSQSAPDVAVATTGLACTVYTDSGANYYQISDSATGQIIVKRTALPATATSPRVFLLARYFIITFMATVSAATHLQYIAIPTAVPTSPGVATDIGTGRVLTSGYDAYVINNTMYIAWEVSTVLLRVAYLSSTLLLSTSAAISGSHRADLLSVTAENMTGLALVWISFWDTTTNNGYTVAVDGTLIQVLAPTQIINNVEIKQLTSISQSGLLNVFYENLNTYSYSPNAQTDFITKKTVTQGGTVSAGIVILRSVGIASKPIIDSNGVIYLLAAYGEENQPTYFLIDSAGNIYMRLAYANGGGYITSILPSIPLVDATYYVPYLIKDFLTTVNKGTNLPAGTPANAIYTQVGINLAKFAINKRAQYSSEIANALHLTGGQLWEYDGIKPVELGFQVYPENIVITTATGAGDIEAGTYYYVFTYEWTDNQGNLHRSAPSIPVSIVTTTASSTNTIEVPTLRLTYKVAPNPVRIVGYRWSVAQQVYYQFTSVTSPVVNDTTTDSVEIVDTLADSAILGQALLYTTGGVIENIAAPASIASALSKNRLFIVDAEDRNLLWFSKQVIENTPVEMSDLLTLYVAPTSGAQGSTGPMTALSAMDDKLIIFKKDAIYYLTGTGPDNTGANNDFSDPIFITSSVGCSNPNSIALMPNGLMFQSDKGIWLLGRDLSTSYIGAPVEEFNDIEVMSAEAIPGTNQVRFVLGTDITLMYDYYYGQWGTFNNTSAISATLWNSVHTYLNSSGRIFVETPGSYLDGSEPVLLSFTTGWINAAGVQGYERFYELYVLGTYYSPFKFNAQLAYDYNPTALQATIMTPDNSTPAWGGQAQWGYGTWGGPSKPLKMRLHPQKQKCSSFQLTLNEIYDPSLNQAAGQGVSLSGLNMIVGLKKGSRTQKASQSFG